MSRKEYANSGVASGVQHFDNWSRDLLRVFDLAQNADLHVVDKQSNTVWIAHLFERFRYTESVGGLHI